jgi:hypothetical protein
LAGPRGEKEKGSAGWAGGRVLAQNSLGEGDRKAFLFSKILYKFPNQFEFESNSNYERLQLTE